MKTYFLYALLYYVFNNAFHNYWTPHIHLTLTKITPFSTHTPLVTNSLQPGLDLTESNTKRTLATND